MRSNEGVAASVVVVGSGMFGGLDVRLRKYSLPEVGNASARTVPFR